MAIYFRIILSVEVRFQRAIVFCARRGLAARLIGKSRIYEMDQLNWSCRLWNAGFASFLRQEKLFEKPTRLLNREELSVAAVLFTTDLLCAIARLKEVQKASTVRERYYCNVIYWFLSRVIVVLPRAIGVQFTQGFTVSDGEKSGINVILDNMSCNFSP